MTQVEADQAKRIRALEAENSLYQIRERGLLQRIFRLEFEVERFKESIRSQAA